MFSLKKEVSSNLLLKFSVSWSHGPPQHRLCGQLSTALDLQRIRECKLSSQEESDKEKYERNWNKMEEVDKRGGGGGGVETEDEVRKEWLYISGKYSIM